MSRKWSTARISTMPGLGDVELGQRRGDHHQAGARHAGNALRGDHQHQQHRDLLAERQLDAIGLGDEDRREGHVHHRAVEIERIAERQHEAGDPRRHAEPVERLQRAREGGLGRGGRESEQRSGRGCSGPAGGCARPTTRKPTPISSSPEQDQAEIEAAHEIAVGAEDRRAAARRPSRRPPRTPRPARTASHNR